MGFFSNLFKKQGCTLCGKEAGALGRTKLKDGEYVCSDCVRGCSRYVRASEFTKDELVEHMEYMKKQGRIFDQCFAEAKGDTFPSTNREQRITFYDEMGMFLIGDYKNNDHKLYPELFRYDQVAAWEPYVKYGSPKEGSKEKPFQEYGVKITLYKPADLSGALKQDTIGMRSHPYVKHPITICFSKNEKDYEQHDYSYDVMSKFDFIFGVNDDKRGLFSFRSKDEKRKDQALKDMGKMLSAAAKAAKAGEDSEEMAAAMEQFDKTKESADAALSRGVSRYSNAADAVEASCE